MGHAARLIVRRTANVCRPDIRGKLVLGLTAEERYERWEVCEDLAQQLVAIAHKDAAKFPENSRDVTLQRVRRGVESKRWASVVEADCLVARLHTLLGW